LTAIIERNALYLGDNLVSVHSGSGCNATE